MTNQPVRFSDGAGYEQMMGIWSRSVGEIFLDWVRPAAGKLWIDVGCGSGAFSQLIAERCAPASILGIDPSESQLDFARTRGLGEIIRFEVGDAMALPLDDHSVDISVAALVVHFMPDPTKGIAEMKRVTSPGGTVAAYGWDLLNGGFPYEPLHQAMRELGLPPSEPPSPQAGDAAELMRLWTEAGLTRIDARDIPVTRSFSNFEDYWTTAIKAPRIKIALEATAPDTVPNLKDRVRTNLGADIDASVTATARANAICGNVA
ncbi:class I SAM-dependent methyltransferase [Devosia naphthalenivorans]|uniref:class I SAM-dependent methyltransferase n=1 Tax=Devosia naphthalenivorans TaxID=2082392 RepID=UPI000D36DC3D|nr:class I SAM-dependent methyltransferase [Devosia naphthalenivorans]